MSGKLAIAPCSWGVEDPGNPDNPPWTRVMDEAARAGYRGMELGPYGFLPTDPERLKQELALRQLSVVAGTLYDDLVSAGNKTALLEKTAATCALLSRIRQKDSPVFLVIIDMVNQIRNNSAGRPQDARRLELSDWKRMMGHIREIAGIAAALGVRPVVHPHAGGFLEFDDETERFLQDIPADAAGLCLDSGHLYYACDDPAESLEKYASRLDYVHFKDIREEAYRLAVEERMGFFDACLEGVMCSIGRGCIDYDALSQVLKRLDYKGWIAIEQERDPRQSGGVLEDISESRRFLLAKGFKG